MEESLVFGSRIKNNYVHVSSLQREKNTVQGRFTLNVSDWFGVWALTLASYLIK